MPIQTFGLLEFFLVHTELKGGAGDGFGFCGYLDVHKTKGATGFGVRLLANFVLNRAAAS